MIEQDAASVQPIEPKRSTRRGGRDSAPVVTIEQQSATATDAPAAETPAPTSTPKPEPRTAQSSPVQLAPRGVRLGVDIVRNAVRHGHRSRTIEHLQRALTDAELYDGMIDGVAGQLTRSALVKLNRRLELTPRSVEATALAALGFEVARRDDR